jgi:hypothetical protein
MSAEIIKEPKQDVLCCAKDLKVGEYAIIVDEKMEMHVGKIIRADRDYRHNLMICCLSHPKSYWSNADNCTLKVRRLLSGTKIEITVE